MRLRAFCHAALLPLVAAALTVSVAAGPVGAEDPAPTSETTSEPTSEPTSGPTSTPTAEPTSTPTAEPTSTPTSEPTATATAEPTTDPMVGAPVQGECSTMTFEDAFGETVSSQTVPCDRQHTTEVVQVGLLPEGVGYDSEDLWTTISEECDATFARHEPQDPLQQALTVVRGYLFVPTVEQQQAGARWYRCDLGLRAVDKRFDYYFVTTRVALPELGGKRIPAGLARCVTSDYLTTVCSKPHAWRSTESYYVQDVSKRDARARKQLAAAAHRKCPRLTGRKDWLYSSQPFEGRTWIGVCSIRD